MKRAILPVSLGLAGLAATGALMWWAFESQREDVAVARAFLTHIAAEEHAEARALMTPALATRLADGGLARMFGQIEPWDHIGFSSRSSNSAGGMRRTELYGTGEAISGCESGLIVELRNGLIDSFNVTPLCPRADVEA